MIELILNTVFSVPYLVIGILVAALFDIMIHYTKVTSRFTLLEIWGCTMFWPFVIVAFIIGLIKGEN